MTTIVGRNLRIEVALTLDTPIPVSAVTKADPGVATSTAHGLTDGEVGFFLADSAGMIELNEQAVMVDNSTTNDFELAGLETTGYTTFTTGTFTAAATWGLMAEADGYDVGGGAADQLSDNRIHLNRNVNIAGLNPAETFLTNIKAPELYGAALAFVVKAARAGRPCLFRVQKTGGTMLRVLYGVPSVPGEAVQVGGLGTGNFSVTCTGYVLKPNV